MRIATKRIFIQPDSLEESYRSFFTLRSIIAQAVNGHAFRDRLADSEPRIQRAVWILKDDLQVSAEWAQLSLRELQEIPSVVFDLPVGGLDKPQDALSGSGLPAARFPNQGERLAFGDVKGYAVDRADVSDDALQDALSYRIPGAEIINANQGHE
jgi:hypothetical protein